ncbi:MAG: NADH:flavin oxidoreductase [Rhodobiaceae bacterium]|jgi:2,4-dienoyl-CoA reductase-like NADH-dependent reductase (Old Yellow Enzyme family)|nr:NADH:flavin oxidoreductase [Rhodobiaceae bacterium]
MTNYPALFSSFTLNGLEIPNRIVMAPMTRSFSPGGHPTEDVAAYYRRRAEGGVGLIITEGTTIDHPSASMDDKIPDFHTQQALDGWKRVAAEVHEGGGLVMPQLWHTGSMRFEGSGLNPDASTLSPSGLKYPGKQVGKAMSKQDVTDIADAFAKGTEAAREAGFDGVQFHGAHGYLIDTFFWEGTNERDDEYGGALEERTAFAVEIIEKARAAVGKDFPLIIRISQWKQQDFEHKMATDPDKLKAFLKPMVDAGIDCFDCSTRRFWEPEFEGSDLNFAGWTKQLTDLPTITVGSVGLTGDFVGGMGGESSQAAPIDGLIERLEKDEFDLVGVGRALLSDPEWANKIKAGNFDQLKAFERDHMMSLS